MPRNMKQALGASLLAETAAFQSRLAKAEERFGMGEASTELTPEIEPPLGIAPVTKVVREAFTIPEAEHAQIEEVRIKMLSQAVAVSKSEVVRAGLLLLAESDDAALSAIFERLERVKTGRPKSTI